MGRRLLSHLLITLAIFMVSVTYFIWVVDATILNPKALTKALREGGVPSALANVIPEQASKGGDKQDQANSAQDEADMKAKIASVVTPTYVEEKLQSITSTVITYMKEGTPEPTITISDFPAKLREKGIEVDQEMEENFAKPIELNSKGSLDALPKAYNIFKIAKYAGAVLFVLLLVAEWFVARKQDRLHWIGRIFLHAGFWYTVWWIGLVVVPGQLLPQLHKKIEANDTMQTLVDAIIKSIQHLFAVYLFGFAIVCWVLALALYLLRHGRKHIDVIQAVPEAKTKAKAMPNKR